MSKPQTLRTPPPEPPAGATTTLVRADAGPLSEAHAELHSHLRAQLHEVHLRSGSTAPDLPMLLRLVSEHYAAIDKERRGTVESMRLMADEARALALEAREQSSKHLQVILDHIKDVVLTVDEGGLIRTFNPTGERVFGYDEAEVVGQRIDVLLPAIAEQAAHESVPEALQRLAASSGDTALDLATRELWARRKNGDSFPAEIAVSKAPLSAREMFVLCLRDVTERRESELAMRESAARYQLLVDHAPEAIVVFDADAGLFVDANDHALAGDVPVFEWAHYDAAGHEIMCEVRLVRLPSGNRRLVRGSVADISERKRSERVSAAERKVFEQVTRNAPLPEVLAAITRFVESALPGTLASVSVLAADGQAFAHMVAPRLPDLLRRALERVSIADSNGSCAAAVHLDRPVLSADVASDPVW